MSIWLRDLMFEQLGQLRREPIDKRIRASLGERGVVDTTRAVLVWEPKRVVPSYAVPDADVDADIVPGGETATSDVQQSVAGRPILDPRVPFAVHTADGEPVEVVDGPRRAAGFRPADPDFEGYVVLDFAGFDAWYEEDERNVGHARDPFHRIDALRSSRSVRVEHDGRLLAETTAAVLLFEPPLPVRYYVPADDVTDVLTPSATRSHCAYKGHASYLALDGQDVAWSYAEPLHDAEPVQGMVAFFNEHVDLIVDGEPVARPITPWSD